MCGHVRSWIFILAYLIFAVNPNSAISLGDESTFSDAFTPLDLSTSSTDLPAISPLDQVALPYLFDTAGPSITDTSDPLSWDESENENDASSTLNPSLFNNDNLLADSPQPIDCSATSDLFLPPAADPSVGKSRRVRRLDSSDSNSNSEICPLPLTTDPSNSLPNNDGFPTDLPGLSKLRTLPDWNLRVGESKLNKNHNTLCYVYFQGRFPWGVCSSGDRFDVEVMEDHLQYLELYGLIKLYKVSYGTLAPSMFEFCPHFSANLFCCQQITGGNVNWEGPVEAQPCILFR